MAFENNQQQNSLNLGAGLDQVKQFQAELDKATSAIGAAEIAAEEEQADIKLKNLIALQKMRVKQLDQIITLEEEGIKTLAEMRLTLSDRQFEARKKEIKKEFQLAKESIEKLYAFEGEKRAALNKSSKKAFSTNLTGKTSSATEDLKASSDIKTSGTSGGGGSTTDNKQGTSSAAAAKSRDYSSESADLKKFDLGITSLTDVITGLESNREYLKSLKKQEKQNGEPSTLDALNKVVKEARKDTEKAEKAAANGKKAPKAQVSQKSLDLSGDLLKNIGATKKAEEELQEFKKDLEFNTQLAILAKEQELQKAHTDTESRAIQARAEAAAKAEDLRHNHALYEQEERRALGIAYLEEQNKLTSEQIKAEAKLKHTNVNKARLQDQEAHKLRLAHTEAESKARLEDIAAAAKKQDIAINADKYKKEELHKLALDHSNKENDFNLANIAIAAKAEDLKNNAALYQQEAYWAQQRAFAEEQNKLAAEQFDAEVALKFIKDPSNAKKLLDQEEHKLRIGHINAERDTIKALLAESAKADDIKNNRDKYLAEAVQNLKVGHSKKENELRLAGINAEAKANELKNNKEAYILEARLARENAFYDERNRLEEERIRAEEEIAWNASNRDKLIAQEEQKTRLNYLAEYQKLQADGFSHLTENMTAAAFEALRAETEATEKAIADRAKTIAAFDKAFAAQKAKGTLAEKNQLIKAIVKERAAEKDWSQARDKFQITDDMDEQQKAQAQKARELAVRTEMLITGAMASMANFAQQLNAQTDKIGARQAPIDTRLQGSTANDKILGSYWKQLARDMNKIGAVNPYFKQEDFASNIEALVNKGISYDVKQRAFLMTIQEKIANTFDVADGTLLRLVRIQQQDTTAGRLGMESALNSFLNSMYETSEYLTDVASSVRGSLEEMQALMEGAAGTELEFQVQKWMGSLYSVGMSQEAVQSIAQTFGQIASGDVSGLTGSGTGNLLIMAANEAGMSIADILQDGLNADETNKLMQAMVNYLAEIAETSSDSRVVQQQLANVYGVKASDLKAATNLASSIKTVSKQDLTYSGMLGQLKTMANSMALRTSVGEMSSNVWDNFQYTMATQMANDPMLYLLPRVATLLEDYAGGIDLPFVNAMGFGVDLNTSVAQLMNVAAMSGTILGSLGPMISGLSAAVNGNAMLSLAGIDTKGKAPVIARGSAQPLQHLGGSSISESGYIGNASGSDIKNATLQDAADSKKKLLVEAKDEESADDIVIKSQQAIVDIYNLLEEVAHGSQSLRVRVINNIGTGSTGGSGGSGNGSNDLTGATPTDGAGSSGGYGKSGADNGNWVLTF